VTPKKRANDEPKAGPQDPDRRRVIKRVAAAAMVAGAAGGGTYAFYDAKEPVRTRATKDRTVPDHRVKVPAATPKMIIARGKDPTKNVEAALKRLGGLGPFIKKGDVVLIKPNVGWDRMPTQAANTNPLVVGALIRACQAAGAEKVIVTDHPVNDPERCFDRSGIKAATQEAGATLAVPTEAEFHMVQIPGKLGRWPVFEPFITATKIINVPIAKHHMLTRATLGMKNWYGILGGRRNQLHQRIDDSVAELAFLMKPTLTVMDATRLLMRNGPTGGSLADVKPGDALAVSQDPVAVDAWAAELLGAEPGELAWLQKGEQKKLGVIDYKSLSPIEIKVS
jgi:uncharacterized protein (DUF362 family)